MSRSALLVGGALIGAVVSGTAVAAGPYASDGAVPRLVCRTFTVDLRADADGAPHGFDTADTSQPIGAWTGDMADRGWQIASVQLAIGQKPTGFPQGYQQVCVTPK